MFVKIDKESFEVVILTEKLKIIGTIYTLPQERLTDFMDDASSNYLPVTGATIYNIDDGNLIAKTKFLSISRTEVIVIFPYSDLVE